MQWVGWCITTCNWAEGVADTSWTDTPPGADPLGRHHPRPPPPSETATEVGGTHPTGMHSCYHHDFYQIFNVVIHFK